MTATFRRLAAAAIEALRGHVVSDETGAIERMRAAEFERFAKDLNRAMREAANRAAALARPTRETT